MGLKKKKYEFEWEKIGEIAILLFCWINEPFWKFNLLGTQAIHPLL
jgi:hypothetical protein